MNKNKLCKILAQSNLLETRVRNSMSHLQESVVSAFNALANISPEAALEVLEGLSQFKKVLENNVKIGNESVKTAVKALEKNIEISDDFEE